MLPLGLVPRQMNPVNTITPFLLKISFNVDIQGSHSSIWDVSYVMILQH